MHVGEANLGILVEKTNEEVGFIHRIIQEFLAARHLHRQPFPEQQGRLEQLVSDSTWSEVLLCLCHLTWREDEVDCFLDQIESALLEPPEAFQRERLLAEIAFGDLHASPSRAQTLAKRTFHWIEMHWWFPLRRTLLDIVINGLNSAVLRETVLKNSAEWFPDPLGYRSGIYDVLAQWPFERATVETMMRGLREDDEWTQRPAAYALAKYAGGRKEVGEELLVLAKSPVNPAVSRRACYAFPPAGRALMAFLVFGRATRSRDSALRIAGLIGLVNVGKTDLLLRNSLLAMATEEARHDWSSDSEIVTALLKGWPGRSTPSKTFL